MTLRHWPSCSGGRIAKLSCHDTTERDPVWSTYRCSCLLRFEPDRLATCATNSMKVGCWKKHVRQHFLYHDTQLSRNSWLGECAHSTLAAPICFACSARHSSVISTWLLRKSYPLNPFDTVPGVEVPRRPERRKRRSRGRLCKRCWQLDSSL